MSNAWTTRASVAVTLGLAASAWVLDARQMKGMDMGFATRLGSFASFVGMWVPMMAAMMLPGATLAVSRHAYEAGRARVVPLFVGSYLAVWTLVGLAVYALYRPHESLAAGVAVIAAGVYEVTRSRVTFDGAAARAPVRDSRSGSSASARASVSC